ncbi:unnamed protein product [Jaminaea pallidilutea]
MAPSTPRPRGTMDPGDPDFTPAALRVVDLRSILSSHNVVLPSSARKADLVRAVEEHVVSQPVRDRNVDHSPQPQAGKRDVEDSANFSGLNPFQARASSAETSPRSPLSKFQGRKSTPNPSSAALNRGPKSDRTNDDARVERRQTMDPSILKSQQRRAPSESLTNTNVPLSSARMPPAKSRKSSSSSFSSYIDPAVAKLSPRVINGNADSTSISDDDRAIQGDDGLQQRPLGQGRYPGPTAVKPPVRKSSLKRTSSVPPAKSDLGFSIMRLLRWVITAVLVSWWVWYVQDSKSVGYCDGMDSHSLNSNLRQRILAATLRKANDDHTLVDLLPTSLAPHCVPCPSHAVCSAGSLTSCESDEYVLRPSIFARVPLVRSVVPLNWQASHCKTDSRRLEMIDELSDEIWRRVSLHAGHVLCGSQKPDAKIVTRGASADERGGVLEQPLYEELKALRDPESVSEDYFDHLWTSALRELDEAHPGDAVWQSRSLGDGDRLLTVPRSLATLTLSCRVKVLVGSLLRAITGYVFAAMSIVGLVVFTRARLRRSRTEGKHADAVTEEILARLAEQSLDASFDSSLPAGLPASHLRDSLLTANILPTAAARKRVWAVVAKRIESNSNVRTGTKRWKSEWMRVWEWVGVTSQHQQQQWADSRPGTPAKREAATGSKVGTPKSINDEGGEMSGELREDSADAPESEEMAQKPGTRKVSFG